MQVKLWTLVFVLAVIAVQTYADSYLRKGSSALDSKPRAGNSDDSDDVNDKYDQNDDDYPSRPNSYRNRYSSYGSSPNNYRGRSRWQPAHDDAVDTNDWSRYGYGLNSLFSGFPGVPAPVVHDNGPTCYSLLDPQYTLFSDVCGAVPQARYSLPNLFGHRERWQIAHLLSLVLGPSAPASGNPSCTRSLRLLLCPLLFPPCPTRYEAPPVLPCQPFCRNVKSQCPSPSLELLPCEILPPSSDLCPVNPTPYSSLLASFGHHMPINGGLPGNVLPSPSLSSLLAQSAFSSAMPSSSLSSLLSIGGLSSPISHPSDFSSAAAFSKSPMHLFNPASYATESLTPILVDFPPISYGNDHRTAGRSLPLLRSATEKAN